jgi:pimeloyl-ACP methyl ester carboxylesterase
VHYCGESSAGTLGMAFAAERPQRVRTLTVISSPVAMSEEDKVSALAGHPDRVTALRKMGSRGWLEASNAGRRFPADTDPALLAWTLDEMGKSDVEVLIAMFRFVSTVDAAPYLPKIAAPVLAIYPAAGVITKDEHTDLLREKVRNLTMVRIPLQAHSLQIVAPATCAREVLNFIARHDGIACRE